MDHFLTAKKIMVALAILAIQSGWNKETGALPLALLVPISLTFVTFFVIGVAILAACLAVNVAPCCSNPSSSCLRTFVLP